MEDQVYLRTTCIQNILHINQPERSFKKKKKKKKKRKKEKHTVVDPTKTLGMSQLSVVQIVICLKNPGNACFSVKKKKFLLFVFLNTVHFLKINKPNKSPSLMEQS